VQILIPSDSVQTVANAFTVTGPGHLGHSLTYVADAIFRHSFSTPTDLSVKAEFLCESGHLPNGKWHTCTLADVNKGRILKAKVFPTVIFGILKSHLKGRTRFIF